VTIGEHTPAPSPGPLPESGLVRAWHASIGGFLTGVEGVIRLAGPVVFAVLLLGASWLVAAPVAALPATQPLSRPDGRSQSGDRTVQASMAAASGTPGMVTMPIPRWADVLADGHRSRGTHDDRVEPGSGQGGRRHHHLRAGLQGARSHDAVPDAAVAVAL